MTKNNTLSQEKRGEIVDITEQLATEETVQAIEDTINIVRKEYGDYVVTKEIRKQLEEKLGVDKKVSNGWQKMADVLNYVDLCDVAKNHPELINQLGKGVAVVVGIIFPAALPIIKLIPKSATAKTLEWVAFLTPEHILHLIANDQANRENKRREEDNRKKEEQFKIAENERLLIIVHQDEVLFEHLHNLVETEDDEESAVVGTADHSVKIVSWTKKTWKNNFRDPRLKNAKILFIGTADETVHPIAEKDKRFEKFGVSYGWVKNQAVISADAKALEYKEYYKKFIQELKSLPLPDTAKSAEKIKGKTKTLATVAATLLLGPIGTAGSLIGINAKDKKTLLQQMLLYGIINLYNNDLEEFMNSQQKEKLTAVEQN